MVAVALRDQKKTAGQRAYDQYWHHQMADAELSTLYEEEAAKSELWLQLVEARQATGLTQAALAERMGVSQPQVARIEKRGYDGYTLTTLRRYVRALGPAFRLDIVISHREEGPSDKREPFNDESINVVTATGLTTELNTPHQKAKDRATNHQPGGVDPVSDQQEGGE